MRPSRDAGLGIGRRRVARALAAVVIFASWCLASAAPSSASTMTFDSTYGGDGFTELRPAEVSYAVAAEKVDATGRLYVVLHGRDRRECIWRLARDGQPDTSFRQTGTFCFGKEKTLRDLVIQQDGRVLTSSRNATGLDVITRYLEDGSLDPSLGNGTGKIHLDNRADSGANKIAVMPDGRIVLDVANQSLSMLMPSGAPDTTWGVNGSAALPPRVGLGTFPTRAILPRLDGSLLVIGYETIAFDALGERDMSYGSDGTADGPDPWLLYSAAELQPDGSLLVGQTSTRLTFQLLRLTPAGRVDTSFGQNGIAETEFTDLHSYVNATDSFDYLRDIRTLQDGSLMAVGTSYDYVAVAKYSANGSPDTSFGTGGRFLYEATARLPYWSQLPTTTPKGHVLAIGWFFQATDAVAYRLRFA